MLKNYLFSPLCSAPSLFQPSFSFSFSAAHLSFFFCLCFSTSLLLQPSFSFLLVHVCTFFQPQNILFSPKQFSLQPKNIFFSPNVFQFFFQPLFSSSFFLLYSFLPLATTYCPFSAQVYSSKPFSAASYLFI